MPEVHALLTALARLLPSMRVSRSTHFAQVKQTRKASRLDCGACHGTLWQECAAASGGL